MLPANVSGLSHDDGAGLAGLAGRLSGLDAETINTVLEVLVEPLQSALPQPVEVVLHDLTRVPNTVRAIAGNVTGRQVGDPPTDFLLEHVAQGRLEHQIGYASSLPDGRQLRCTTILFRDSAGKAAAALCLNSDVSSWLAARAILDGYMVGPGALPRRAPQQAASSSEAGTHRPSSSEYFPRDVEELASFLIRRAIEKTGVPVELMRKEHKVAVVSDLQKAGFFLVKDATETVAAALQVSRFTIYNYLNEIQEVA
ncbi:helix-turn-helix transcriptional regulator [Arthrobacter cavernae]|uniref:Transcriptional regulator n=1 Tax=Arthrobacter cavernae TaxID=2817681 RepID=A0A939HL54_9MICC|nr:PAS domain-containing protein [Arthrobacter cavernae]MBO1269318.1 transcriptional regulator [Arthrobacter cavernae]